MRSSDGAVTQMVREKDIAWHAGNWSADYRYANPQAVSDPAWYKFDIPATANYRVEVWYPALPGYSTSAPYHVVTSSGSQVVFVDQRSGGGAWRGIGTFNLAAGDYNAVGVSRCTSGAGLVTADAVRLTRVWTALDWYLVSDLAREINELARLTGNFTLRSGRTATEYFDKYRFESEPRVLDRIAAELSKLVPANTQVLAGLELGGIPIVTALGRHTGLPCTFVRKKAKEYGTAKLAEGADVQGRQVLVVEDVVTSGGQVIVSADDLRRLGARIDHALCVIDRQEGGAQALAVQGIELTSLFTRADLDRA